MRNGCKRQSKQLKWFYHFSISLFELTKWLNELLLLNLNFGCYCYVCMYVWSEDPYIALLVLLRFFVSNLPFQALVFVLRLKVQPRFFSIDLFFPLLPLYSYHTPRYNNHDLWSISRPILAMDYCFEKCPRFDHYVEQWHKHTASALHSMSDSKWISMIFFFSLINKRSLSDKSDWKH